MDLYGLSAAGYCKHDGLVQSLGLLWRGTLCEYNNWKCIFINFMV